MPSHRAYAHRTEDQLIPPPVIDPLNGNVSHVKFQATFQSLAQDVNKNSQGNDPTKNPF